MNPISRALKPSCEQKYATELQRLAEQDRHPKPKGWQLSAYAVRQFILGDPKLEISQKFYGDDPLVDRALVTLMGNQALMLVGEPGTAKSLLSELLSAAISGSSQYTIQGSAGTTEDQIKYAWNYALLLAQGPTEQALIPSALYAAMQQGCIARFEEITRCAPEIQDVLLSILSEKQMMIPEFGQQHGLYAQQGFNLIASANLRDRGVHEMSSALKRRFNFETVKAIKDRGLEVELLQIQLKQELQQLYTAVQIKPSLIELLVTVFSELRNGQTEQGTALRSINTVMSSAEAVNVAHAACLQAIYLGNGELQAAHLAQQLAGVVFKEHAEDASTLQHYLDTVVKARAGKDQDWRQFYQASREL